MYRDTEIWRERLIYYKKLSHMIMEAKKSRNSAQLWPFFLHPLLPSPQNTVFNASTPSRKLQLEVICG